MRLVFNATALLSPLTGIGQYGFHLAGELLEMPGLETDFFYGTFWDKARVTTRPLGISRMPAVVKKIMPLYTPLSRIYRQYRFSQQIKIGKYDVYHEPNYLPLRIDCPTVITVHDLSWIRYPETHPAERVSMMNNYFEKALSQASALITDAEFVKQEIIQAFGVNPDKITAIPLGVEAIFRPRSEDQTREVLLAYELRHKGYFVTVGTLEPRKNLSVAIRAYSTLPESIRKRFPLVVVGMIGWHSTEIERLIAPLKRAGYIRQLGYVSRSDLAILMAGAATLIYPSIYEGFGLPPLEAMACGTPVICSNVSTMPEVVGDAGILIDPHDVEGLQRQLEAIISDPEMSKDLSVRARRRSLNFSWRQCAEQTLNVYQSVTP